MARHRGGRVTVRITGIARLRVALEQLPDELKAELRKAVREAAEAVQADTRRGVRVKTGNLRDKVAIRYTDDDLVAQVGWFEDREYYARFHEYGTYRFPAQPALGPALEAERARVRARLSEALREVLR